MKICLGIDASAQEISAALVVDGTLAAEEIAAARPSGEVLLSLIDRVLGSAGRKLVDVTSIAVGVGPGSFTGIRNGIATAQGLATPLGGGEPAKAVYGVSALLAAAHSPGGESAGQELISFPANGQENFAVLIERSSGGFEVRSGALVLPAAGMGDEALRLSAMPGGSAIRVCHFPAESFRPSLAARSAMLVFQPPKFAAEGFSEGEERESLLQTAPGGRGLKAVYAKPVHAKTLAERGIPLTRVK